MNADGTGTATTVADVAGGFGRHMHVVNGFVYVSEGSFATGCSAYRIWRTPVTSVNATSVQPVANSSVPFTDFDVGPNRLLMLRNAVWSAPAVP